MYSQILRMLVVLLGVAGTLMGVASAQEDAEEHLWDLDDVNITDTLSCDVYEEEVGSCNAERLCKCDELCEGFSDCCHDNFLDYVTEDDFILSQSASGFGPLSSFSDYRVCVELPSSMTSSKFFKTIFIDDYEYALPVGYIMVGKCPPSWKDPHVRQLCEAPQDVSDLLLLLPFVSSDDRMTSFRNIYCTICNGVTVEAATSWRIESNASLDSSLGNANDSNEIVEILDSSKTFDKSSIRFNYDRKKLRNCIPNLVEDCPDDYEDEGVIRACRSYMTAVVHPVTKVAYRNWHCAFCNDAIHPRICQTMGRFFLLPPLIFTSSLIAMVDFKGNRFVLDVEKTKKSIENTCGKEEFLDPFTLRCRTLLCPGGSAPVNGVCLGRSSLTGIIYRNCTQPGFVEMEVDMCLDENAFNDPCELWKECLRLPDPPEVSGEWCKRQRLTSEGGSCALLERVHLTVNSTVQEMDHVLIEGTETPRVRCPFMASVSKVVLKRECIPHSRTECNEYSSGNVSDVYFLSWNKSEVLYLRNVNSFISLQTSFYQKTYTPRNENVSDIFHRITICGDPVDFDCPLVNVNSTVFSRLLNNKKASLTDTKHAILETSRGDALVCHHLVSELPFPDLGWYGGYELQIVTTIGFVVSMLTLVASFITYLVFPSLRNLPGQCVMSLIVAVFSTQLFLLMTSDDVARSISAAACTSLAILLHYSGLSAFSWTNALAFYLARTLGPGAKPAAASQRRHSLLFFSLFGWGVPLIIVFICVILHVATNEIMYGVSEAHGGIRSCSITDTKVEIVALVVPITVSLLANAVFFIKILVGFTFRRAPSTNLRSKEGRSSRKRRDAFISVKIGFLLAFTWIFGFLATAFKSVVLLYIFCIMTSLQGVYIFLAFTFTQQVKALWREKLGLRQEPKPKKTTQKKYLQNQQTTPPTADKGLCRQHSPSEHQTADTAHSSSAKDADQV